MTTVASPRIPAALQAVFMASNKGEEVYVPPTDHSANRVYRRHRSEQGKPVFEKVGGGSAFLDKAVHSVPPQAKFHMKLKERGYSPRNYSSKRSAYYNQPTEHQLASYGNAILDIVKRNQVQDFRRMLEAGLSPNACNAHGESLLHMVCRHGKTGLFRILVAFDVDIQQTDDYGRTPMHDCCWASMPSFEIATWLIRRDPALLFLYDARGSLPLSYVTKSLWGDWNAFLDDHMDAFYPVDRVDRDVTPELVTVKPNSRPVPDPKHVLPANMAKMVAMGTLSPYQAIMAQQQAAEEDEETVQCSEFDSDSDDDSSIFDSDDDDSEWDDEDDLYQIVGQIGHVSLGTIEED